MLTSVSESVDSLDEIVDLAGVWARVESINTDLAPDWHLPPVMGGGCTHEPSFACVFINPTHRNASTQDGWNGPRYPWIGTKAVWKVFANAGMLPTSLSEEISRRPRWDERFAAKVYDIVSERGLYITNLVKWTGANGDLPSSHLVNSYIGILRKELQIVRPRAVVAFGGLTYRALTGADIRLAEVLERVRAGDTPSSTMLVGTDIRVHPCFFPTGRGNPKGATEILAALAGNRPLFDVGSKQDSLF